MAGIENYIEQALQIEHEIVVKGYALNIDWADEAQLRALARDALIHGQERLEAESRGNDLQNRARLEFFGLVQLMLKVMQESAGEGMHTHGGPIWKAFSKALWAEAERLGLLGKTGDSTPPRTVRG